jgi:Cd2+/Zn2+-exporting ATPase
VTDVIAANCFSNEELLRYAAIAESNSSHPIAVSILKAWGRKTALGNITEYEEIAGKGIRAVTEGKILLAGNRSLLESAGITGVAAPDTAGTVVCLAVDGVFAGSIVISDELKSDSKTAIADLRTAGVKQIIMLTGDTAAAAEKIGGEINVDAVYAGLLPHQKVEKLEALAKTRNPRDKLVFVGDGINDAPVLARSDVGIAMGGVGSDAAIEAADVVLMTDEPSKVVDAIRIAKKTRSIVRQNIVFALGIKAVILALGAMGIATMWEAVFGDVGVALIAVFNAMRALRPLNARI